MIGAFTAALDAFLQEHRRCGEQDTSVEKSLTLRSSRRSPPEASCLADGLAGATQFSDGGRSNNTGPRARGSATIGPQPCTAPKAS